MRAEVAHGFHLLTGVHDLAVVGEIRPYIGQLVFVEQVTKSGMVMVRAVDGYKMQVPKRNLSRSDDDMRRYRRTV